MPATRSNAYIAGFAFVALFVGSISLVLLVHSPDTKIEFEELSWWKKTLIYHVYVPSFSDSDGDGVGDLKGLTSKLEYIQNLGVESIWLSPIYESEGEGGNVDFIIDHAKIDSRFGTEADFKALLSEVEKREMKIILDFIPNHTSKNHTWFQLSENKTQGYEDYYIWRDEPNSWTSVTGESAWTKSSMRNQSYLHNYLPEMPQLNLRKKEVRDKLLDILDSYLKQPPIMGFHISGFNILIGDEEIGNVTEMVSDINETISFLNEVHELTKKYSKEDKLDRLIMLEMVEDGFINEWSQIYLNQTTGIAVVPFSFGSFPVQYGINKNLTGLILYEDIQKYLFDNDNFWPCWEMNDHDIVRGLGRFPIHLNNIFFMLNLLLPGTSVIYYGDEIGMHSEPNDPSDLEWAEVRDPYTTKYCTEAEFEKDECICRDPSRTPMQWNASTNAGFTSGGNPWLPVADDYNIYNVQAQQDQYLETFRNISRLRDMEAFKSGDVFFPFHDDEIFTFMRKAELDDKAFIVVIYVVDIDYVKNALQSNGTVRHVHRTIDFTNVMPNFPVEGVIVASSDHTDQEHDHPIGSVVDMSAVEIDPSEGFVIELDFGTEEDDANDK